MQSVAVWKWSCSEQHEDVRVRNLLSVKTTAVKPSASKTPLKSCTTTTTTSHVIFLLFHFEVGNGRVIVLARFCPEWLAGPEPEPVILLIIPVWGALIAGFYFYLSFVFFPTGCPPSLHLQSGELQSAGDPDRKWSLFASIGSAFEFSISPTKRRFRLDVGVVAGSRVLELLHRVGSMEVIRI